MIAIRAGRLIDGRGGSPVEHGAVLVDGNRIVAVGSPREVAIPEDAQVFDFLEDTVLPGLIDGHVHFAPDDGPRLRTAV